MQIDSRLVAVPSSLLKHLSNLILHALEYTHDIDMPLIGRLPFLTICAARLRAKQLNQLEHKLQS